MNGSAGSPSIALAAGLICLLPASPLDVPKEGVPGQFPTTAEEARALDESEPAKWADGPVQLIFLEEEEEIWGELDNDEQRRRFIALFWARRDEDLRDRVNPAKFGFYSRVAEANQRFTDLGRGWRTDRGRAWIVLGQPDRIRTDFEDANTTWTYFALELQLEHSIDDQPGELDVHFSRVRWFSNRTGSGWPAINNPEDPLGSYRITGSSLGGWPRYVLRAMDFVRRTMVANPDMQWRGRVAGT